MVKSLVTKWHLVTQLFTMVWNHSIGKHLNTVQEKTCYSDKFTICMFTIQIPTVLALVVRAGFSHCRDSLILFFILILNYGKQTFDDTVGIRLPDMSG